MNKEQLLRLRRGLGFTLIELMIAVAIIGILAAIAIPTYGEYAIKSRVSELLSATTSVRTSVSETILSRGGTVASAAASTAGNLCGSGTLSVGGSKNMSSLTCNGATGVLTAVGTVEAGSATLILSPTAANLGDPVIWKCSTTTNPRYVPAECN